MTLVDPELLQILRCPVCHRPVAEDAAKSLLRCDEGHEYPVVDGIPNMLPPAD